MPAVAPLDLLGSFQTKKQQKHLACFVRTSKNSFFNKKLFFTSFFDCCPLFLAHTLFRPFHGCFGSKQTGFLKARVSQDF